MWPQLVTVWLTVHNLTRSDPSYYGRRPYPIWKIATHKQSKVIDRGLPLNAGLVFFLEVISEILH